MSSFSPSPIQTFWPNLITINYRLDWLFLVLPCDVGFVIPIQKPWCCKFLHPVLFVCACLVSEEENLQGWFFAEDDGNQMKKQKHPLLLRQMPVVMSKLQEFKVRPLPVKSSEQRRREHIRCPLRCSWLDNFATNAKVIGLIIIGLWRFLLSSLCGN